MPTKAYPLRIDERILDLANLRAKEEYVDKSTALRQLLYQGAEEYALRLYEDGRISIGKVSELLGKSIYDVQRLLKKKGIKTEQSDEILRKSRSYAKKL